MSTARPSPVFAVVGHPNRGKSSVVATLSQNDAIAIALEPGTTRESRHYPLTVDGQLLYTLVDTPGFQRPRRVLEWLEAHSLSAADRPDTVAAFVRQHRDNPRFHDECELLEPLTGVHDGRDGEARASTEGAGIIYVVDGSVPYSAEHEAEMTILRWTGRPSLALINRIGQDDHTAEWQSALGQFFQIVRIFDAVRAPFEQHLGLLRAFGQLRPDWEQPLADAVSHLTRQRQQRVHQAARLIADALADLMHYQATVTVPDPGDEHARTQLERRLREQWYQHQRAREQQLRQAVEALYQHHRIKRQEAELEWHQNHDLFSEQSREAWAVSRTYLAGAGFGAGAVGGAGFDVLTLGGSLGTGALVGGLIGAAGSYFYGDRLAVRALRLGPLRGVGRAVVRGGAETALRTAKFGPVQDPQFGYIVLGRAVDHWWHISQRNHAGRDLLELPPTDSHWLDDLDKADRKALHKALTELRKRARTDPATITHLTALVERSLEVYEAWRLNQAVN